MTQMKAEIAVVLAVTSPSAFFEIQGKPNIVRAFTTLATCFPSQEIIVAVRSELRDDVAAALSGSAVDWHVVTCEPASPQDLARVLETSLQPFELVLIHDASRPFVDTDQIEKTLAALIDDLDAVRPTMPFTETLKVMNADSVILRTVDRSKVLQIATPELIRTKSINPEGEDTSWFLPLKSQARLGHIPSNPLAVRISSQEHCDLIAASRS